MTVAAGFTPTDLELMIKHELRKDREVSEALLIRIIREGASWRAEARFKASHTGLLGDYKASIAKRVTEIGEQLAPGHRACWLVPVGCRIAASS